MRYMLLICGQESDIASLAAGGRSPSRTSWSSA